MAIGMPRGFKRTGLELVARSILPKSGPLRTEIAIQSCHVVPTLLVSKARWGLETLRLDLNL